MKNSVGFGYCRWGGFISLYSKVCENPIQGQVLNAVKALPCDNNLLSAARFPKAESGAALVCRAKRSKHLISKPQPLFL